MTLPPGTDSELGADEKRLLWDLHDQFGVFETLIGQCYTAELRAGATAVDGGAHTGLHTAPMAEIVGSGGFVLAFEPVPHLAADLRQRFAGVPQISVYEKALSDQEGLASFQHIVNEPSLSSLFKRDLGTAYPNPRAEELRVERVLLDRFADMSVRFIKLDLEGGEYFALLGSRKLLALQRPVVVLECGRRDAAMQAGYDADAFFSLFAGLDYHLLDLFGSAFGPAQFDLPWDSRAVPHYIVAVPAERPEIAARLRAAAWAVVEAKQFGGSRRMPTPKDDEATRIWDERYGDGTHVGTQPVITGDPIDYTQHKLLYAHGISLPTTGRPDGWIVSDVAQRFLVPPPRRVLALGSGMAFIEETLLTQGYADHIVAYEMSPKACAAAMERVRGTPAEGRLEMRSANVLDENLPEGAFDAVFVQAAIHHFDRIDEMFALMHRVLKPEGLLLYDEYVGPDHHQFPPEVMEILNLVNDCLGPPYRFDWLSKETRERMPEPSLEAMMALDPSEGVHASRILPLTYRWFDVLQRRDYGGTLLRPFFTGILPNFDWQNEKDQTVARLIVLIERLLLQHGAIPTYHTNIVGRRRPAPLPPLSAEQEGRIGYADWQPPEAGLVSP